MASCEHTMLRSAGPTMGGASAHSPTRAVHRKDAIRIAKEHAAAEVEAATAELVRERDTILARAASDREYAQAEREAREQAERERDEARAEGARLLRSRDEAYTERNALVAALSKVFPASLEQHDPADTSWDPEWLTIVAIELPTGQATWHLHDRERGMFAHLRPRTGYAWDGHTTAEKYARIAALAPAPQESDPA